MSAKILVPGAVLLALLFIAAGDHVFPQPVARLSTQARESIIRAFTGLVDHTLEDLPEDTRGDAVQQKVNQFNCEVSNTCP